LEYGYKPYNILALTFTNKAAREMKERIFQLVGNKAERIWAGTFHSIFLRVLRIEGRVMGFNENFTVFCAGACIVGGIITALFMSMQRYYVEGVTSGAVKG
jgi:DNA helicase-2/ATP-dependent DNA helicase PcrA